VDGSRRAAARLSRCYHQAVLLLLLACHAPGGDSGVTTADGLILSAVQSCPDPVQPAWLAQGEDMVSHEDSNADHLDGGGVVVEDLDGDGALEVMIFFEGSPPALYHAEPGGVLREEPVEWPALYGRPRLLDYDSDGDLDILMTSSSVLWGDGTGGFVVEVSSGGGSTRDMLPLDLNGDGAQDLFVARSHREDLEKMRDLILWGDGSGGYIADEEALPEDLAARKAFDARLLDFDHDGDLDVYVVNDMGHEYGGNVLWRNEGGALEDATEDCDCGAVMSGMGVSAGDRNGDGWLDLYITGTSSNLLLEGSATGSFVDITAVTGADPITDPAHMAWGSTWLDHDSDGDSDLLVLQGDLTDASGEHTDAYDAPIHLLSATDGVFTDVREALSLTALGSYRAVVAAELSGDGVLDFVVTDVVAHPWVFISQGCTAAGWLEVIAPEHSRVVVENDGLRQTAVISRDTGFGAVSPARAWFGLGASQTVDSLTITTPDGQEHTATNLDARRTVTLPLTPTR
jgi:hypothetical protein